MESIVPLIPPSYQGEEPISLEKLEEYVYDENRDLLKYCDILAENLWISEIPGEGWVINPDPYHFLNRYRLGEIDTSRLEDFLNFKDLQDTLKAFHLDISKFWYLCLFIKDVVDGKTINARLHVDSPICEIGKIISLINDMNISLSSYGLHATTEKEGTITVKVSGNHLLSISNPRTLLLIKTTLEDLYNREKCRISEWTSSVLSEQRTSASTMHRIYLFNNYLKEFLKLYEIKPDRRIHASKDKNLLISRMIYVLGLHESDKFKEEYKENGDKLNYLRDYLRGYKPPELLVMNSNY